MRCTGTRRGAPQQESVPKGPSGIAQGPKKQSSSSKNKVRAGAARFTGGGAGGANNFIFTPEKFKRLNTKSLCFLSVISNKSGIPIA
jgi:hypothetical protein